MSTPHLNPHGCEIRVTSDKGRGVFAVRPIAPLTTVDISPVLLFTKEEYENHGRHTVLDHYTFKWRDGSMALALGLGSLLNHSSSPNVSFVLDTARSCIIFTTMRYVAPEEELCIFYGDKLWFDDQSEAAKAEGERQEEEEDMWERLAAVELEDGKEDPDTVVNEAHLPFEKVAFGREDDEEELEGVIQTLDAWVVDIPDPRQTASMIQWLKDGGLEHPSLKHTKHVRRWTDPSTSTLRTTLLLTPAIASPPAIPHNLSPYVLPIPRYPARTMEDVKRKGEIWPVFLEARSSVEEQWTKAMVRWFCDAVDVLRREAKRAKESGELPIVAYVPSPLTASSSSTSTMSLLAHDTRISSRHPLRHSVFNVVRLAADTSENGEDPEPLALQNGVNYLLTGRTLFTTHEPCIACSMALLHSRVKEVVYLHAMARTGGCGSVTCVPGLKGVNHRYRIWKWKDVDEVESGVPADADG